MHDLFLVDVAHSNSESVREYRSAAEKGLCLPPNWSTGAVKEIISLEKQLKRIPEPLAMKIEEGMIRIFLNIHKAYTFPMILHCPECNGRHIDEGEFAHKVHHTHACQHCGHVWRPAVANTHGVQFLPGFKNKTGE